MLLIAWIDRGPHTCQDVGRGGANVLRVRWKQWIDSIFRDLT